jgi:hypothetical protein
MAFQRVRAVLRSLEEEPEYQRLATKPIGDPEFLEFWQVMAVADMRAMTLKVGPGTAAQLRDRLEELRSLAIGALERFAPFIEQALDELDR